VAATGARTAELCALEWQDLDLEEGTLRFRQALSSIDQQLATGRPRLDGARGKLLVVGPLKTPASQAILSLPAFALDALRDYEDKQGIRAPLRLLLVQPGPAPRPAELDLLLRTERGTPVRPEHASRAFRAFAENANPGPSASAAPLAGVGDGGGQGARQRDRRAAAPRRRRHAGQ
jgi:integrase